MARILKFIHPVSFKQRMQVSTSGQPDHTRKVVEEQLIKAKYDIKDGMDISLCCLNEKEKTISWAGAMNPLWIVRKNSNKVEELIPDRQPVGKVQNPIKYSQH